MQQFLITLLLIASFSVTLQGCAPFKPSDNRAAVCNQLNSNIVFTGSTGNTRNAEIERAEQPLTERSYEANNCDGNSIS